MKPLISVIVPVYKTEPYLKKCVDSILAQTYRNLEVLLIDDGSPDRGGQICDEYAALDRRVRVIHQENQGLSCARNAGLDACRGEYVAFVDSDDFCSPIYLEAMLRAIAHFHSDIAILSHYIRFPEGTQEQVSLHQSLTDLKMREESPREVIRLMMYQRISVGLQFMLCKRETVGDIRCPAGWVHEDAATAYRFFMRAQKATVVDGLLYAFRVRMDSQTRGGFSPKKMTARLVSEQIAREVPAYDPDLAAAASSLAFSIVYTVFLQVPSDDLKDRKIMWNEILKYRDAVLRDRCRDVRLKNRGGALVTFLGMNPAWKIGRWLTKKKG